MQEFAHPATFLETYHTGKSLAPNLDQTLVFGCFIIHRDLVENFLIQLRKTTERQHVLSTEKGQTSRRF